MPRSARSTRSAIEPRYLTLDGINVRYAESEPRDEDALLLCPWPESLYAYDQVWSRLAERTHLVAVDLPGFGQSQRRDELLSPRAMGAFMHRLIDGFGLDQPHAVGPDVGTAALLFAAADRPGRLRSLVVGSGGVAVPIELRGALHDWVFAPDVEPYRRLDPGTVVSAAIDHIKGYPLPDDIREDYLSAYEGNRFVESMAYVRAYPDDLPVLQDLLPGVQTPVQIFAGRHDDVVPPSNAQYLHDQLPHSRLDLFDTGHYVWEEDPNGFASMLRNWWDGGYIAV